MYEAQQAQLDAKTKLLNALMQRSFMPQPTQMVSGRAIPQGPLGVIGPIAQGYLANHGLQNIQQEQTQLEQQKAQDTQDALKEMIMKFKGKPATPYNLTPEQQFGNEQIPGLQNAPVAPDIIGGAMMTADPRLAGNKGAQTVAEALLKQTYGKTGTPAKPFLTTRGYVDPSTGQLMRDEQGNPWLGPQYDVNRRTAIAGGTEGAKLGEQLKTKPAIAAATTTAVSNAAMANPNSKQYQQMQKEHSVDLKTLETANVKTDQALKKIRYVLDPKNSDAFNSNFGGYNALATQYLPGAQDMKAKIDSVKSDLKSAGLEMIRSGGSIGMMTEREWPIVEQMIDTIKPTMSESEARQAFMNVENYLNKINQNAKSVYNDRWSNTPFAKKKMKTHQVLKFDAQGNPL